MISDHVLDQRQAFAGCFANARPFRHVVIDDFLLPAACKALLDTFPSFEDRYALNEMGAVGNKAVRTDVDNLPEPYRALDAKVRSAEFLQWVSDVTGIPDLRYDPDYIGGGTHENRDGQALEAHVDFNILPGRRWHRRLNLIVYLNPHWETEWGGCLELHSDPWSPAENQRQSFLPLFNRCVIFETHEVSWHGFETIRLPAEQADLTRKSFAIYLYTEQRPEQELAPSHGTVYVPAGMPHALQPGMPLDAAWHGELERRFGHLLGQLKFLYRRELEFSDQLDHAQRALREAESHSKIDLQGYAVQHAGARGFWPDGWMARDLRVAFATTVAAKSLKLEFWVPPGLGGPQTITASLGELVQQIVIAPGQRGSLVLAVAMPAGQAMSLGISASMSWQPSDTGESGDQRELAYRLVSAVLRH